MSARFEARSEERILASRKIQLSFAESETVQLPFPRSFSAFAPDADIRILVFVDDLLLEVFDYESLLAYDRVLEHTGTGYRLGL